MDQITKIKTHFRKLGYELSITQGPNYYREKHEGQWMHILSWKKGNDAARLLMLCEYYFEESEAKEFGEVYVNINKFKPRGYGVTGICKKCGCTDSDGCYDHDTGSCWWVKEDLCSACASPAQKESAINIKINHIKNAATGSGK